MRHQCLDVRPPKLKIVENDLQIGADSSRDTCSWKGHLEKREIGKSDMTFTDILQFTF